MRCLHVPARALALAWACSTALLGAACGARSEPREGVASLSEGDESTRSAELELSSTSRTSAELARDPAWESIPAGDSREARASGHADDARANLEPHDAHDPHDTRDLDTHEGEVAAAPCTGACSEGDHCTNAQGWPCRCEMHVSPVCGGAYHEPDPPYPAYTCTPPHPTADRGDGCPYREPTDGARCTNGPATCAYAHGPCGWSGSNATCRAGRWSVETWARPPPP
ncbi:MAG: hypothetical protein K1X94_30165 [Sandaracinaceae bacterium]|nr:hypothetical protein [Sandaracinaceae bacterium]